MNRRAFIATAAVLPLAGIAASERGSTLESLFADWQEADVSYATSFDEAVFDRIVELEELIAAEIAVTARDFAIKISVVHHQAEYYVSVIEASMVTDARAVLA